MIFCAGSSSRACISKGRRCSCSACSAIRAERFDERTAENVAPARASVPPAVASDEMATQSATTLTLRPARRYRSIDGALRFPRADPRRSVWQGAHRAPGTEAPQRVPAPDPGHDRRREADLHRLGARPTGSCSKYCLGIALTHHGVKTNAFNRVLRGHFETVPITAAA